MTRRGLRLGYAGLCAVAILPAGVLAMLSFMLFDDPAAASSTPTLLLAAGLWAFPGALAIGALAAWIGAGRASPGYALRAATGLPIMALLYILAMFGVIATLCRGMLACR